ncbi:hypothetical protein L861_11280 [Litchfieldella anticariensis FP35 = DSM 16096]|uniref:Lipo-like protein n=1 Tax=Litchfieldella anticariensis (strain DSM 16096 / CECT 5854 / CIP 108499 / LMG 22089 / FP35) TaxID=1121939 RepID=S2L0F7_LITA3|nr:hypothetical protein L861_11280 [Halomonas anticariensis FP35 = DSM 16096]
MVEGTSRISTAIKYLTQSSWSHAALYIGNSRSGDSQGERSGEFIEADVVEGIRIVDFDEFRGYNLRICRPVGLRKEDIEAVVEFACQRIGYQYDLRNIFDLARYLLPIPPVPSRWRRRMLGLGSGEPTRAICSTLIAQAFQSINYPILPDHMWQDDESLCQGCRRKILKKRHHTLFTPRDFDFSPYFLVIKPLLETGFTPYALAWEAEILSGEIEE